MEWETISSASPTDALDVPSGSELRRALVARHAALHAALSLLERQAATLAEIADALTATLSAGHKILVVGNGGSAAEAQHFASELVGRYLRERHAYAALALTTDSSVLTAIGNDYGFGTVFARQVAALGQPGDALLAFSTSGTSENVLRAAATAEAAGLHVIAITGAGPNPLANCADFALCVPADDTPFVQELHMLITHLLCEQIETRLATRAAAGLERV